MPVEGTVARTVRARKNLVICPLIGQLFVTTCLQKGAGENRMTPVFLLGLTSFSSDLTFHEKNFLSNISNKT